MPANLTRYALLAFEGWIEFRSCQAAVARGRSIVFAGYQSIRLCNYLSMYSRGIGPFLGAFRLP